MDTYYMSTAKLIDLLKTAYTKGYHGFLDLADSTVEEMLRGLEENKYSPKDVLINEDFVVNDSALMGVSGPMGTTITGLSGEVRGMAANSVVVDGPMTSNYDILPENITLEQEAINLNTGDG